MALSARLTVAAVIDSLPISLSSVRLPVHLSVPGCLHDIVSASSCSYTACYSSAGERPRCHTEKEMVENIFQRDIIVNNYHHPFFVVVAEALTEETVEVVTSSPSSPTVVSVVFDVAL